MAGEDSAGRKGAEGADSKRGTLCRSSTDKVIAGVAGGIGAYFGIDAVIVRIAFIVLTFLGGAGPFLYLIGWLALPQENSRSVIAKALGGDSPHRFRSLMAVVLIGVGLLITANLSGELFKTFVNVWTIAPLPSPHSHRRRCGPGAVAGTRRAAQAHSGPAAAVVRRRPRPRRLLPPRLRLPGRSGRSPRRPDLCRLPTCRSDGEGAQRSAISLSRSCSCTRAERWCWIVSTQSRWTSGSTSRLLLPLREPGCWARRTPSPPEASSCSGLCSPRPSFCSPAPSCRGDRGWERSE